MKMILRRDNVVMFTHTDQTFFPKIVTKSSTFKNEYYELIKIENGVAKYDFLYEKSHDDDSDNFVRIYK